MSESDRSKKILAVDTALGACSVAVLDGQMILAHRFEEMARGHAEALAPMVRDTMAQAGFAFSQLDCLAVTTGPGTFTGQRVGLAFMRGLRVALKKPLSGITTLEAMAAATGTRAAAIHDAKREEAYLLLWDGKKAVTEPEALPFAQAVEKIRAFGTCALAGTGAPAAASTLGADFSLTQIRQPDALWVARLALQRPPAEDAPAPLYLRAPDAKLPQEHRPEKVEGREAAEPVFRTAPKAPIEQRAHPRPGRATRIMTHLFDPAKDDVALLAGLHRTAFPDPWDVAAICDLLAGPGVFAVSCAKGFVLARVAGGEAEILTLAVDPAARGQGLGRALLENAARHAVSLGAESIFLEVGTDNPAALALYARLGFRRVGQRKGYYAASSGADAWVMKVQLPLPPGGKFA